MCSDNYSFPLAHRRRADISGGTRALHSPSKYPKMPRGKHNLNSPGKGWYMGVSGRATRVLWLGLVLALAVAANGAENKDTGKCMMWEARSSAGTVYLLGSLHFGSDALYPLNPVVDDAYAKSDTLVLEMNMDMATQLEALALIQQAGMYKDGKTLSSDLSEGESTKLAAFLKERGMALAQFESMKPWLTMMMLTVREMTRLGYRPQLGLDMHFYEKASASGKPVVGLETAEEQVKTLSDAAASILTKELMEFVDEAPKTKEIYGMFEAAWKSGDPAAMNRALEEDISKDPEVRDWYDKLIDGRNVRLADRIAKLVSEGKKCFVIVGSAHLVTDKSILKLLEAKGFTVTQVEKKPVPKTADVSSTEPALESTAPAGK